MIALLIAVTTVVLVSAMCSLFEAVLYSIPMSRIEALIQRGKKSGKLLQKMREQVDAPITAILSLNTISNTAGAAVASPGLGPGWVGARDGHRAPVSSSNRIAF